MYTYQSSFFYHESLRSNAQSDEFQTNGWDLELALTLTEIVPIGYGVGGE